MHRTITQLSFVRQKIKVFKAEERIPRLTVILNGCHPYAILLLPPKNELVKNRSFHFQHFLSAHKYSIKAYSSYRDISDFSAIPL